MWKRDTADCILSRWSTSERKSAVRASRKIDIDLYENLCLLAGKKLNPNLVDWSDVRTTTEISVDQTRLLAARMSTRNNLNINEQPFRRARAQHTRIQPVFLPLDGKASLPGAADSAVSTSVPIGSQLDSIHTLAFGQRLIRPGPVTRHHVPLTTVAPTLAPAPLQSPTGARVLSTKVKVPWAPSTAESAPRQLAPSGGTPFSRVPRVPLATSGDWGSTHVSATPKSPALPNHSPSHSTRSLLSRDLREPVSPKEKSKEASPRLNCFQKFRKLRLINFEEKKIYNVSLPSCLYSCQSATNFYCASVNYNEQNQTCEMNGGNVHLNRVNLLSSTGDFYENSCIPLSQHPVDRKIEKLDKNKLRECFNLTANATLVSFDATVAKGIRSLASCVSACYFSPHSCFAVNWLQHNTACMMFTSKIDRSQLLPSPNTLFLENKCTMNKQSEKGAESSEEVYYNDESDEPKM